MDHADNADLEPPRDLARLLSSSRLRPTTRLMNFAIDVSARLRPRAHQASAFAILDDASRPANLVFAITLGDVGLADVDAAGLTLGCPPSATLGGSLFSRMATRFLRVSVCHNFLVAVTGIVPFIVSMSSAAVPIIRSFSEIAGVLQCAG